MKHNVRWAILRRVSILAQGASSGGIRKRTNKENACIFDIYDNRKFRSMYTWSLEDRNNFRIIINQVCMCFLYVFFFRIPPDDEPLSKNGNASR